VVIGVYFTKWTECHTVPNIEGKAIVTVLIEHHYTNWSHTAHTFRSGTTVWRKVVLSSSPD